MSTTILENLLPGKLYELRHPDVPVWDILNICTVKPCADHDLRVIGSIQRETPFIFLEGKRNPLSKTYPDCWFKVMTSDGIVGWLHPLSVHSLEFRQLVGEVAAVHYVHSS